MDEPTMKKLWTYNTQFPVENSTNYGPTSKKRKQEHPEDWAGHSFRGMLQLLYIVSMLCLLRYDEALRITWQDVKLETEFYVFGLICPSARLISMEVGYCILIPQIIQVSP
jgi:hypothetical protein